MPLKKASELESKEIEDLNAKVTSLENKLNKLELKKFEKQILINKIPKHPAVKRHAKESSAETKELVKDFLDSIEYKDYIPDCYRIPLSIKQASSKKEIFPVICCTFASKNDKMAFYGYLKKLKETENYKNVSISDNIPPFLMGDYKLASDKAYNLRKNDNSKTKIRIVGNKIKLFSMKKMGAGSKIFKEIDYK